MLHLRFTSAQGRDFSMLFLVVVGSFAVSFLLACAINWLALLPWRRASAAGAHWTERARLLWPVLRMNAYQPLNFFGLAVLGLELMGAPWSGRWVVGGLGAWLGATLAQYFITRETRPGNGFGPWVRFLIFFMLMHTIFFGILIGAMIIMPADFGGETWLLAGGVLVFLLANIFGLHRLILRLAGLTKPAPPALDEMAARAARATGAVLHKVWIYEHSTAFAGAFPTTREMMFSTGLVERLSPEETEAICFHEAAHLTESNPQVAMRVLMALALYPLIFVRPMVAAHGLGGLVSLYLVFIIPVILYPKFSRKMEKRADQQAIQQASNPAIYARALEKLSEINQTPVVLPRKGGRTHPDTYDRMLSSGYTPNYARPGAPARFSWPVYLEWALILVLFIVVHSKGDAGDLLSSLGL